MSMKKLHRNKHLGCFLSVVLAILILSGCSQKAVNDNAAPSIALHMKVTEPALIESVTEFLLIVTGPGMDSIKAELALSGGHLEGEVDVPAGRKRKFEVQARDQSNRLIYRGSTTVDVEPGKRIDLTINLYPVVPLVKLSPRFQEVGPNSPCSVDVKVFRIRDLYGISFRIHYDGLLVYPDSAVKAGGLGPDVIMLPPQNDPDSYFYATGITQTDQESPIVDENGYATLARVFFTSNREVSGTARLTVEVTELRKPNGDYISLDSVYIDGSLIEVQPDTNNPIVSFPDPMLDSLIRDMIGKEPSDPIFESDVDTISFLAADGLGILDLSGLANLTNLHYLNLEFNQVSDISELSSLTKLGQLFLGGNKVIRDISPLAGHPQLFEVGLEDNQISDIGPLYAFYPNNTLGLPAGLTDKVWLSDNPQIDTTQVDSLCDLGVWVDLDGSGLNWCSGL